MLLRIARGNEHAFRQFYEKFVLYVTNVVYIYRKEGTMAVEDYVQDVFSAVWKYRAKLESVENIQFYLYAIAKNKVLNFQKRAANSRMASLEAVNSDLLKQEPYVAVDYKRMLLIYRQTVNSLPPQQKKAFQLRYEGELSGREVGMLLGITHFTVKNLVRMARRKLKQALVSTTISRHSY